ncbi:MAG: DNA methyltransferase, partial [Burkholderiales bacterium]
FGRDISRWVGKTTVLPSNLLTLPLVGKNKGHPAVFPIDLPEFFIKLLSRPNSLIIDPFGGSGTTAIAAINNGRDCVLIDNNLSYCELAHQRIQKEMEVTDLRLVFNQNETRKDQIYNPLSSKQMVLALNQRHTSYSATPNKVRRKQTA